MPAPVEFSIKLVVCLSDYVAISDDISIRDDLAISDDHFVWLYWRMLCAVVLCVSDRLRYRKSMGRWSSYSESSYS